MNTVRKRVSIIIPVYNEQGNLPELYDRVTAVTRPLSDRYAFEYTVLDNASEDSTQQIARGICERDPEWRYVRYSRNFGFESSLMAGLDFATGDAVITLLSDLQDPPEIIPRMLELWEQGNEVVFGKLETRNDESWLKTLGAKVAYQLIYHLSECKIVPNATDFRLLDRKVVNVLRELREPDRYMRGLVHWVGFKQFPISYSRAKRQRGESNARLYYCIKFALHAVVCFSRKPLRVVTIFGLLITAFSCFLAALYLAHRLIYPIFSTAPPPGLTTVFLLLLFLIGTNALFLGVIGEYVGRIYNQGKRRPLYIVDTCVNVSPPVAVKPHEFN
jgi:glycosyltransferase involved in cell wall biosynthesis